MDLLFSLFVIEIPTTAFCFLFPNLPETLILTAEYDPLRDEGEVYGRKLHAAGNHVEVHRIYGAFHGFFALGIKFLHVQESFKYINQFLNKSYEKILQ